jgi:hypothetical protein
LNFTVKKYHHSEKTHWDQFISEAKNATFLFYRDFMDYHSNRFEDHSLLVYKAETLVALVPANVCEGVLHSHQGLSYGGFVLRKDAKFNEALPAFKAILTYLDSEGIKTLQLKLLPKMYHSLPSDEIDYLLFKLKAGLTRRDVSSVIDNSHRLMIKSSNRKRGIKKGIKNNLRIVVNDDYESFWHEILIPNLQQTHGASPVHTLDEIITLSKSFPKFIKQYNVYHENRIVAGATVFETDLVAHVQYISANETKQQLGSLDYLFSHLINEEFKEKRYFDFGISNENKGEQINEGLHSWKESFGGRSIVHDFYEIQTTNYTYLNEVLL